MKNLEFKKIINENITSILNFAFSYQDLTQYLDKGRGGWETLSRVIKKLSPIRAERAVVELAVLLRFLDDSGQILDFLNKPEGVFLGFVMGGEESGKQLSIREVSNKIIHSREFKWDLDSSNKPKLICVSNQPQRWESAEIDILELALLCSININSGIFSDF